MRLKDDRKRGKTRFISQWRSSPTTQRSETWKHYTGRGRGASSGSLSSSGPGSSFSWFFSWSLSSLNCSFSKCLFCFVAHYQPRQKVGSVLWTRKGPKLPLLPDLEGLACQAKTSLQKQCWLVLNLVQPWTLWFCGTCLNHWTNTVQIYTFTYWLIQ